MELSGAERWLRNAGMIFWAAASALILTNINFGIANLEYVLGTLGFLFYGMALWRKARSNALIWIGIGAVSAVVLLWQWFK